MSDIYVPGIKSRFNSEKIIEGLMQVESIPKERTEKSIENLGNTKSWWDDLGRRVSSLRDSARMLFSYQNPFNERNAVSSNENIITAAASREAEKREYQFAVKQLAQADRFLSPPVDEKTAIDPGSYVFSVGKEEISFDFKGGSLREFVDMINRRGRGMISASFMTVQPGTKSVLVESKITGAENSLGFSGTGAAADLAEKMKAVAAAQDAIISMEGIEMSRPSNVINDIIPGVTVTARGVSEWPQRLEIQADREGIKEAIFSMVGNYNRLMAEINVLTARRVSSGLETRLDDSIINELAYLTADEAAEMKKRLGAFSGDSMLLQYRSNLMRAVSSPYPTDEGQDLAVLSQIGISTNALGSSGAGYTPSRLRGYLEIDEKKLDAAVENHLPAIRQLFASDTSGDLLADTGVAFNLDDISRPLVEKGGIISLKTGTIDSRISQDKRRIETMERQLAAKEADLKMQYGRMESAYERMEKMSSSLDNFSKQNSNNR
ncbi:MAG: flagellar filament capping protein FliD [Treponema sp.]|jgi:flagellar capping protein FliD|nr:flagellar filament capping protein FliD [Treponema sp.]